MASHIPLAGSVFQWAKYLSNKTHAWFTGWIYLFAGILTIFLGGLAVLSARLKG